MIKTVLELDLVGYSAICNNIAQSLDEDSVARLNAQIQSFIDAGLAAVDLSREKVMIQTTGDGAILLFDSAVDAHSFAVTTHSATAAHNSTRSDALAKRVFRIGAATGEVVVEANPVGGFEIAGTAIARAVRLEAKAAPGGILIDESTFAALNQAQKDLFGEPQSVTGKRNEVFTAYFAQIYSSGPREAKFFIDVSKAPANIPIDFSHFDAFEYVPDNLIGREIEMQLLRDEWAKVCNHELGRSHILVLVALGGEGKTSLVAKWVAGLASNDWPGTEAVFLWSFYRQGGRDQATASANWFLTEALKFFGDAKMADSNQSALEKGRRLAQLICERRALLILDGLEPLQHASTNSGELRDKGISALLQGLAGCSNGLCVITTRYSIPDLRAFLGKTVREENLRPLSKEASVVLLRTFGINGTQEEFSKLAADVKGHALTLNLLGSYLRDYHAGDIRQRDLIRLNEVGAKEQGGHAFRVMDAYVKAFENDLQNDERDGHRTLALLQLLGLFDRPAAADCLNVLWSGKVINGLTDPLFTIDRRNFGLKKIYRPISNAQRNRCLKRLEDAKLITISRDDFSGELTALDTHPLVREYLSVRLRNSSFCLSPLWKFLRPIFPRLLTVSPVWRAAHYRLHTHLRDKVEHFPKSIAERESLRQAVIHGCYAEQYDEAFYIYRRRITHYENGDFTTGKLRTASSDLETITCFFEEPWRKVFPAIPEATKSWLLQEVAICLRASGRLNDAIEPMRESRNICVMRRDWDEAAIRTSNLSELEIRVGDTSAALSNAEQAVKFADLSKNDFTRLYTRTTLADVLNQLGCQEAARKYFQEAHDMESDDLPWYPVLKYLRNFQYSDLLLAKTEREAWKQVLRIGKSHSSDSLSACHAVKKVYESRFLTETSDLWYLHLIDTLMHLTQSRATIYSVLLDDSVTSVQQSFLAKECVNIDVVVEMLRVSGEQYFIVSGLLTRAWQRFLTGERKGINSAQSDLDEAWDIASRGPMRLHMADIYLYRARLFGPLRNEQYPWGSAQADLVSARHLIQQCGYWRRKEELKDAEEAAKKW